MKRHRYHIVHNSAYSRVNVKDQCKSKAVPSHTAQHPQFRLTVMQLAQGPTRRWREVSQVPPALHPCSGAGPSREPRRTRSRTTVALAAFTVALGSGTNRLRIQRRVRPERKEVVQAELAERKSKEVLPYAQPQEAIQWPNVLDPMKRQADLSLEREDGEMKRQNFQGKRRSLQGFPCILRWP